MPVYVYVCPKCSDAKQVSRPIDAEEKIPTCDTCQIQLVREYRFGLSFKGTGFYTTDKNK